VVGRLLVPEGSDGIRVNTAIAELLEAETTGARAERPKPRASEPRDAERSPSQTAAQAAPPDPGAHAEGADAPDRPDWDAHIPTRSQTMREALRDAMSEEMRRDETVFLLGEEIGEADGPYRVTQGLLAEFGARRVVDAPTTAQGFTGLAVGAAFGGLRPVVEFMTFSFALQAMDQIVNSAARTLYRSGGQLDCPIVFRGPNGAAARVGAQHSQCFAAWFAHIPGLKVVMPSTAADAKGLLKSAIRDPNPVVFLENEMLYGRRSDVPVMDDLTIPIGTARIARAGRDVTLVSFGIGMTHALEAAELLARDGISAEVIDLRSLRPMDTDAILRSVRRTNRCVTVEEGLPVGSIGDHITAVLMREAFDHLDAPVIACTGQDVPMPYAENLERRALISTNGIVAAVRAVCYR
jgi:pyruvate dehydrogenase E1 component beta subunit